MSITFFTIQFLHGMEERELKRQCFERPTLSDMCKKVTPQNCYGVYKQMIQFEQSVTPDRISKLLRHGKIAFLKPNQHYTYQLTRCKQKLLVAPATQESKQTLSPFSYHLSPDKSIVVQSHDNANSIFVKKFDAHAFNESLDLNSATYEDLLVTCPGNFCFFLNDSTFITQEFNCLHQFFVKESEEGIKCFEIEEPMVNFPHLIPCGNNRFFACHYDLSQATPLMYAATKYVTEDNSFSKRPATDEELNFLQTFQGCSVCSLEGTLLTVRKHQKNSKNKIVHYDMATLTKLAAYKENEHTPHHTLDTCTPISALLVSIAFAQARKSPKGLWILKESPLMLELSDTHKDQSLRKIDHTINRLCKDMPELVD